jgi:hypothetical protein
LTPSAWTTPQHVLSIGLSARNTLDPTRTRKRQEGGADLVEEAGR